MRTQYETATRAAESNKLYIIKLVNQALHPTNLRQNLLRITWESFYKSTFNYDPSFTYHDSTLMSIRTINNTCFHYRFIKWNYETSGLCCSSGKVSIPLLQEPPEPLESYLCNNSEDSDFSKRCTYNSYFQITLNGANQKIMQPGFTPTFTIQDQIYYTIRSILPPHNNQHGYLQIYLMSNEIANSN